jgi:hypothetical protein
MPHRTPVLLIFFLLFAGFFLLFPNSTQAATCAELDGRCGIFVSCRYGAHLPADDCDILIYKCCPNGPWDVYGHPQAGIKTALGVIEIDSPNAFIGQIIPWAVGLAGLIALLSIVYGGFLIMSAAGDPKKVAAGREIIVTTITGIAIIALSIVLLNFIGVTILNLGPLGFNV